MKIFNRDLKEYSEYEDSAEITSDEEYVRFFKIPSLDNLNKRKMKREIKKHVKSISAEIGTIEDANCRIIVKYEGQNKDMFYETLKDVQGKMNREKKYRYGYEIAKTSLITAIPILGDWYLYHSFKDYAKECGESKVGWAVLSGLTAFMRISGFYMFYRGDPGDSLYSIMNFSGGTGIACMFNTMSALDKLKLREYETFDIDKYVGGASAKSVVIDEPHKFKKWIATSR